MAVFSSPISPAEPDTGTDIKTCLRTSLAAVCKDQDLRVWFDALDIAVVDDEVRVTFPHPFFGPWFAERVRELFEHHVRRHCGETARVAYLDRPVAASGVASAPRSGLRPGVDTENAAYRAGAEQAAVQPFGDDWTFAHFVSGARHKWVIAALREILAGSKDLTLLVMGGSSGVGKTHLLRATANAGAAAGELWYGSVDELEALCDETPPREVWARMSSARLFLLDDMHRLTSAPRCAAELVLLLDRRLDQGRPSLLAGTGRISDWPLETALRSRLESGLWTELPEPDLDVRLRYLQAQTRARSVTLSRDQLLYLAQRGTTMRRLLGLARRLAAHKALTGRELTDRDLETILIQGGRREDASALTAQEIISTVGEQCGVPPRDILGDRRRPDLVQTRQIAMLLCRELLGLSYPAIGRLFGGKDHSTVIHAVKKIKIMQERDKVMHSLVTALTKECLRRRE